jgi:ElaB/YqjD/DUF883 family membrane-anchored ribosome-binding protein
MSKPLKKVTHDLEALLDDVVHALKHSHGDMTEEAQEKLAAAAARLAEAAQSIVAEVKARSAPVVDAVTREAKARPLATAATLAMAAAAVAGLLMNHHKSAKT